jgi:transposase
MAEGELLMAARARAVPVRLNRKRRRKLTQITAAGTSPQRLVLRARIVLAAAEGTANVQIARDLGCSEQTVRCWRGRFAMMGIPGIFGKPLPGRPETHGPSAARRRADQHRREDRHPGQVPPAPADPGQARPGRPPRVRVRPARHRLHPRRDERRHRRGHRRADQENDSVTFIRFLAMLHQMIPPHLRIHLIMDNGSSHTSKATRAWLAAHPRFAVTYTPKRASWLNIIGQWLSLLTRKLLRRGDFTSPEDLEAKITAFTIRYNKKARPSKWSYDADADHARYLQRHPAPEPAPVLLPEAA